MTLHFVVCPSCGMAWSANGRLRAIEEMRAHVRANHPDKFERYAAAVQEVRAIRSASRAQVDAIRQTIFDETGLFIL